MSRHLKLSKTPTSWPVERKKTVFITKPLPGPHSISFGMPLDLLLKDLGHAQTKKEIKQILNTKEIIIDGRRIKESKFPIGLFDTISIPAQNQHFRITFDKQGKIAKIPIQKEETTKKISKVIGKTSLKKGKLQLNLSDGRNILTTDKTISVGDTLLIEVPTQKIQQHFKLEKGALIYLVDGKHVNDTGKIDEIKNETITYTNNTNQKVQTLKEYAYVIGKEKPAIKIP